MLTTYMRRPGVERARPVRHHAPVQELCADSIERRGSARPHTQSLRGPDLPDPERAAALRLISDSTAVLSDYRVCAITGPNSRT